MNNNLQLVLKSSTTEMSLNDHDSGIYIVPELDGLTGLPEIRTTSGVNAGYDGGWTSAQKFDARSIVIRGVIANEDKTEVERMRRELVALLAQGKNEQLELDFVTETGRAYEVQVRTIACDMAMQRVLTQQEFMITLRADDPLIYDNSSAGEEATVNVSGATGGFRIPFEIPLAIDAGSEETVVQNSGLESVAPTIKMYGALHNPKIINHTTNQAMQVEAELGFTEGAWTTPVDAPEGTNVSFEPGREAPIESAKLKGNTTQQTYTGKNLINTHATPDPSSNLSQAGVTYTIADDGTITTSGTSTATYKNLRFDITLPAGTYRASGCPSGGTKDGYSFDIQVGQTQYYDYGSGVTFTLSEATTIRAYAIRLGGSTGVNMNGKVFKPMITVSTAEQTYEPYVGGIPAPNPDYPQPVQVVTGENVVKICTKNIFDGETINAWLRPDGTAQNSNGDRTSANYISVKPNTTYTLHGTLSTYLKFTQFDSSKTAVSQQTTTSATSLTVTTGVTTAFIRIGWGNAANASDVMLELGSTATAYEPYQGQSYEVNLGKNLFDKDNANVLNAYFALPSDTTITSNAQNRTLYVPCNANTTYTFQAMGSNWIRQVGYTATTPAAGVSVSGITNLEKNATSTTITTGSTAKYLVFRFWHQNNSTETYQQALDSIQIEKGSTATSYAAYFEPIELCKIGDYQDYIWKDGDTWKVHKATVKATLTSTSFGGWQLTSSADGYIRGDTINNIGFPTNDGYCDKLTLRTGSHGSYEYIWFQPTDTGKIYIQVLASRVSALTQAAFNTWLDSATPVAYYPLATPTETAITNSALIEQLEALVDGSAVVYEGETHIAVTAVGNMPGITAIRYYTDKEPDQRDELIIDSRLKTITLNGLDVYHLQAPGSEFLMLAPGENKLSLQSDITGDNGYAKVSYKQGYLSI